MKYFVALCLLSALAGSCSSTQPRTDISANAVPMEEISKLESGIKAGYGKHLDVLAHREFEKSQRSLNDAKTGIADKKENRDVLNDVTEGRNHLDKALEEASDRSAPLQSVIDARQAALNAGAQNFPRTQEKLKSIDEDVQEGAESAKNWKAEKVAGLQKQYLDLELVAITSTQLGKAAANIENAKNEGAKSLTPKTFKTAEVNFTTAENVIATNRNEPSRYSEAVRKAVLSADFLNAVITTAKKGSSRVDEATAVKLVNQDRKVSQLQTQLGAEKDDKERTVSQLQTQLGAEKGEKERTVAAKVEKEREVAQLQTQLGAEKDESVKLNDAYAKQGQKLKAADVLVNLQNAIDGARKDFSTSEAEVFQQGNTLLIRLKSMKFSKGRAELPSDSLSVLAKVKNVALELGPKSMLVEGHTDSTGDSAVNLRLSRERAQAVATYFGANGIAPEKIQTAGYGFEKPIASNKTNEGRAQNRRVDVIITPTEGVKAP